MPANSTLPANHAAFPLLLLMQQAHPATHAAFPLLLM
jgi:hypothetical protein